MDSHRFGSRESGSGSRSKELTKPDFSTKNSTFCDGNMTKKNEKNAQRTVPTTSNRRKIKSAGYIKDLTSIQTLTNMALD